MARILGTIASSFEALGDFESIATVSLSSSAASAEFTSISSDYTHLQVRGIPRTDRAGNVNDGIIVQFNSDTGANYSWHYLAGVYSTPSPVVDKAGVANTNHIPINSAAAASGTAANSFGSFIADILDYKDTNKYKTLRALSGMEDNTYGYVAFSSGNWRNTNAITTVTIKPLVGTNFVQYSHFALYGIKGA